VFEFGRTVHKSAELSPNWRGQMGKKLKDGNICQCSIEVVDLRGLLYSSCPAHLFSSCETGKEWLYYQCVVLACTCCISMVHCHETTCICTQ